jgi:hypothetical protein
MLGRAPDFEVANAVLIDGAEGKEKRVELAVGERSSADDNDEPDSTEKRG